MRQFEALKDHPEAFDAATALRIAELRAGQSGQSVAILSRPDAQPSPHAIQAVTESPDEITIETPIYGLLGPLSPLPISYSETAARQDRKKAQGMTAFLSIFSDRFTWLFAEVCEKYNLARLLQWSPQHTNTILIALRSLIGLGGTNLTEKAPLPEDQSLRYAGQLARQTRSAIGLESILAAEIGLPVEIEQFHFRWHALPQAEQTQLAGTQSLEHGLVAGGSVPDQTSQIRISIGPMRYPDFLSLEEGQEKLARLRRLTRFYVGPVLDFEFRMILDKRDVPATQLGGDGPAARLGWNSWAKDRPAQQDSTEATLGAVPRVEGI